MAASREKKPKKKSSSRKRRTSKRVQEERADAFRRGVNAVLTTVLVLVVLAGAFYVWTFLGRPGWPVRPGGGQTVCVEVWFYDNAVTYLVPVHRRVTLAPGDSPTVRAVQEFAEGPHDSYLARVYPDDIPAPQVRLSGDVAFVDLPAEIVEHFGGYTRERALLDALTLTAAAAGECTSVRILIAGEAVEATPEGLDLSEPLEPPEFINHVSDSSLEGDSKYVTCYFLDSSGRYLIPLSIEVTADVEEGRESIERLLRNPPQLAYPPPLPVCPDGYTLEKLMIENGTASIDLSVPDVQAAFMDSDAELFRCAAFQTLKRCCDITDVALLLNGREIESYSRFGALGPVACTECWNLERQPVDIQNEGTSPAGEQA